MKLHELKSIKDKKKKKIGRGYGSGKGGHTVGKGMKGQRSRSGFQRLRAWIRQAQITSIPKLKGIGKRSAKRGYAKSKIKEYIFNVKDLNVFEDGDIVSRSSLRDKALVTNKSKKLKIKILGSGNLEKKLTIKGIDVSESAQKKIEKAGGAVK